MEKFWRAALAVAGLGAVGSFVFWGLYKQWLSLKIFANITSEHTFIIMLVFLVLTFFALIAILITYIISTKNQPVAPNANTYSIPDGTTFNSAILIIASRKNVQFKNFTKNELAKKLTARQFEASDDIEAIKQLRLLINGDFCEYSVKSSDTGIIIITAKK